MMSSESLDEKLIEAVREFTCIWQVNSKAYKDKVARENAWKIIANQIENQSTLESCKRWKQLRDRYVRESRKVKEKRSGASGPPYISLWPLFQALTFLEPTIKHRKTETNVCCSTPPLETSAGDELNADVDPNNDTAHSAGSFETPSPQHSEIDVPGPALKKRKTKDVFEEAVLLHLHKAEERRQSRQEKTDDDHFALHVGAVLKKLPPGQKAVARVKIEQILLDAEYHGPSTPPSIHY